MSEQETIKEYEQYLGRVGEPDVPEPLKEGAPTPRTWLLGDESCKQFAEAAREYLALQRKYEFAHGVAVRGFYPDEMASDELHPGAEMNAATGEVHRHWQEQDDSTIARARAALHGLAVAGIYLDGIMETVLQAAAAGGHAGAEKTVAKIIERAESAIQNEYARRKAAAREEAAQPVLTVRFGFKTHKQYEPGSYRIPVPEAEELLEWKAKMEAEAKLHEWDWPVGFDSGNWPPFTLKGVPQPVVADDASGQLV